jgi:hypothetical protein
MTSQRDSLIVPFMVFSAWLVGVWCMIGRFG